MRIRKLEIAGFKSFVDRTVIHFDTDVVGIVGPNGCGKSNIVDAIRWTMGEQSAKHLRGRAMSDVIFGGSESRPPAGLAEVTLTFDNSDPEMAQHLPLEYKDYAEIAVTRRLFRDGTSEYLINKTSVRLKDVTDLFLGTGVGTKAYSIIEQGKIGLIVSARPEDRRMLIEEAAGITKYKARKKQAEQKMDQTRQNLLRVGDIVAEIERSLSSLKRQAAKAERWMSYRRELDDLVLHESSHRLLELIVRAQWEAAQHEGVAERALAAKTELAAREATLEAERQAALSAEEVAERAQNHAFRATAEVQSCEAEIARSRDKMRNLDERRASATRQQVELEQSAASYAKEREQFSAQLLVADEDEAREAELALGEHERLDELRHGEREAEDEVQRIRRQHAEAQSAVAAAEATLEGFERRVRDLASRRIRLEDELATLSLERETLAGRRADHARGLEVVREAKAEAEAARTRLDAELRSLREEAVGFDRTVDQKKNELAQRRNRLRALEELHERHEGVGAGVANLLARKDPTVVGLVADLIEAPAELVHALAGALGEEAQCVVVRDATRGAALLGELRAAQKGRASILPRTTRFVAGGARPPAIPGVRGHLVDRLRFEPEDEAVARALLGDVLVVDDVAAGFAVRAAGWSGRAVTLDGTLFSADGRVVGGQGDRVAAGMIEQKREIRELHGVVAAVSAEVTALLERQASLRESLSRVGHELDQARTVAHESEKELLAHEKDLRRAEGELASVERREGQIRSDLEEIAQSSSGAEDEVESARAKLDAGLAARDAAEGGLDHAEMRAAEWRERVLGQQSIVTERKVGLARLRERSKSLRETVERLTRSCEELRGRIDRLDQEREHAAREAGRLAAVVVVDRERLVDLVDTARAGEVAAAEARARLDEARAVLTEREQGLRGLRQEAGELAEATQRHAMALERISIERTHLEEGVRERFRGLELARVVGDYHKRPAVDASHRARIGELGELIDRMGPVNLDAVREHEEASKRFEFYSVQKTDLEKALSDLEQAIEQMNRECKRLFRATFDGVNANFRAIFPQMFRGGAAELRLTNGEDMLETGIEILAQPPGKKLGTIELMSGGEKALTAVALIFAIFQFKPSPFCILDEVDAPLDEANVARYNDAIRRMTDRSQFILITHIKRTMQSVDVLYGVTMQEPGVSKLVSVRVNETATRGAPASVAVA